MDLRRTFNTDEYNYDKSRPDYPKELFDHNALSEKVRNTFENDMKKAIDDVGGVINIYDTIDLYLAHFDKE